MTLYTVRQHAESYGHAVGIILVDVRTPFIPGDVGNASTYPFPVVYRTAFEVNLERLINQGDKSLTPSVIAVAKELENLGVRAITSDCGYMLHFQKEVAAALSVPVILSSLLQLPLLESALGGAKVGIICANKQRLVPELLDLAGMRDKSRAVIYGLEHCPAFRSPILDEEPFLDDAKIEKEVVDTAKTMLADHPDVGTVLLECSNLPPYAHAVQRAIKRPVFDFTTMINLFQAASFRRPFQGFY